MKILRVILGVVALLLLWAILPPLMVALVPGTDGYENLIGLVIGIIPAYFIAFYKPRRV